jgi:uncharacterized Fe-S cluster-containing radical SAM superfamily protein
MPWVHIYREQDGTVSSCCESTTPFKGLHSTMSNDEIFNSTQYQEFRNMMMENEWPSTCSQCKKQEELGMRSSRQVSNRKYKIDDINQFKVKWIDHRSSNLCNFSCKMCSGDLSSTLAVKEGRFGKTGIITMPAPVKLYDDIRDLEHLQFAGGEPLLLDSTFDMIQESIDAGSAPKQTVGIITNGSLLHRKKDNIIDMLSHFRMAHITVSVDAIGKGNDYWRHKNTWDTIEKNLEEMIAAQVKKFEVCIRTTLGWHNCYAAREVYEKYDGRIINHFTGTIIGPDYYALDLLTQDILDDLVEYWKDWPHVANIMKSTIPVDEEIRHKRLAKAKAELLSHELFHGKLGDTFENSFPEMLDFYKNI